MSGGASLASMKCKGQMSTKNTIPSKDCLHKQYLCSSFPRRDLRFLVIPEFLLLYILF